MAEDAPSGSFDFAPFSYVGDTCSRRFAQDDSLKELEVVRREKKMEPCQQFRENTSDRHGRGRTFRIFRLRAIQLSWGQAFAALRSRWQSQRVGGGAAREKNGTLSAVSGEHPRIGMVEDAPSGSFDFAPFS